MRNNALAIGFAALLAGLFCGVAGLAQDFQQAYTLPRDGTIRVRSISGEITVLGYDGQTVVVKGFRVGRDRDRVEITDKSAGDRIDVGVRYPEHCNCDASVNFEVQVPRSVSYNFDKIGSISGSVVLQNLTGHVSADSTSGNVSITDVSGEVSAQSVSGNVEVSLKAIKGPASMKFSSISGNVLVKVPAALNAYVEMSTLSGSQKTNSPLEVQERRYGPGRSASGRVGEGASSISIRTISGRVSLTHDEPSSQAARR